MTDKVRKHIFVVDDNVDILEVISLILKKATFECTCFTNADDCLQRLQTQSCDLLITDVRMPGTDGMKLLAEVKRLNPWLPVIVVTSYGDIPLAIKAIKTGAFDFIEKPLDSKTFLAVVESGLQQNELSALFDDKSLTRTERIVLRLILQSKSNKQIAHILNRSVRTIEVHRSHIMHKLDVDNVVDLVKRAAAMGFDIQR